jgi:hypothetical protein
MRADLRRRLEALEASAKPASRDEYYKLRSRALSLRIGRTRKSEETGQPIEPPSQEELDLMAKLEPGDVGLGVLRNLEKMRAIIAASLRERI